MLRSKESKVRAVFGAGMVGIVVIGGWFLFHRAPVKPVTAIIGIDTSGSARPKLGEYVLHASRFTAHLEPNTDNLSLFRVDFETQEFYHDKVRGGREAALKRFLADVARQPERNRTLPETFWKNAAQQSDGATQPVCVLYFSDGDNDDMRAESRQALLVLGSRLAANPQIVSVQFVGVKAANRLYWEQCFAALGKRLILSGENEMQIETTLERMGR